MSNRGSSFVTEGVALIFPARCLLVPLLENHVSRVPAEQRGCDCHHSRVPSSNRNALYSYVDSGILLN